MHRVCGAVTIGLTMSEYVQCSRGQAAWVYTHVTQCTSICLPVSGDRRVAYMFVSCKIGLLEQLVVYRSDVQFGRPCSTGTCHGSSERLLGRAQL